MKPGDKVKLKLNGKIKQAVISDSVHTLWVGGQQITVLVGTKEMTIDERSIIREDAAHRH